MLLQARLVLLLARLVLLLHLAPCADGMREPSDTHTADRPRCRVAGHRPARRAEPSAAEPAPRVARRRAARGLVQDLRGDLLRVYACLLHGPVVALVLVTRHLLVALIPGRVDVDALGGERARVLEYQDGHPHAADHL